MVRFVPALWFMQPFGCVTQLSSHLVACQGLFFAPRMASGARPDRSPACRHRPSRHHRASISTLRRHCLCWLRWRTAGTFSSTPTISPFCPKSSIRSRSSVVNLALTKEDPMSVELLRASEAARRLEMSTKELLRLVHGREIRYEMVEGIAQLPTDALEEYRAQAS